MKEVVILGTGPSIKLYRLDDKTEVWGLNNIYKKIPKKLDKLFFFDDYRIFGLEVLQKQQTQLVSKHPIEGLDIEVYPLDEIKKDLKTDYFANTFCYMIAYALWKGYEMIRLYGVDMATGKEQSTERPCMEYWVGFARGRGATVVISPGSRVCAKTPLYGYETSKQGGHTMANFKSRFAGLSIKFRAEQKQVVGNEIVEISPLRTIDFVNGNLTTNDPDEIAFLRKAIAEKKYGQDFIEIPSLQPKVEETLKAKPVTGKKTTEKESKKKTTEEAPQEEAMAEETTNEDEE